MILVAFALTHGGSVLVDPVPVSVSSASWCTSCGRCARLYVHFKPSICFPIIMGPPDPPPNFLPTHLVIWVASRPVSLAPVVGIIYDNGTDFMSQYLTPPVSLPDMAPSLLEPLGGILFGPRSVPLKVTFSVRLFHLLSVGCFMRPYGECPARPCPSRCSFWGALSLGSRRGYI
jgi:hypothetical protein